MRISTETESLMSLKEKGLWFVLLGVLVLIIGLATIIYPNFSAEKIPLWMSLIFIAIGILAILAAETVLITFDKSAGKMLMQSSSLLKGKRSREIEFDSIKEIVLEKGMSVETGKTNVKTNTYNLILLLKDGEGIFISKSSSSNNFKVPKERGMGQRISLFLKIPFSERGASSLSDMFRNLKESIEKQSF